MQDFVRIMPKQSCEEWPAKLGRMALLFNQAEYQMIKNKLRRATILHVDPENLQEKMEQINEDGLIFTPLRKIGISQSYSLLAKPVESGKPFLWTTCLTSNSEDAELFKEAYSKNDHKTIGRFLGYPECCINYFSREFPSNPDPVWVGLSGKVMGFPECNTLLRYFGVRATGHMPCSPKCEATVKLGKIWLETMKSIDLNLTKELYNLLAGPITWDSYHGVVQVETPYFIGLSKTFPYLRKPRIIKWSSKLQ